MSAGLTLEAGLNPTTLSSAVMSDGIVPDRAILVDLQCQRRAFVGLWSRVDQHDAPPLSACYSPSSCPCPRGTERHGTRRRISNRFSRFETSKLLTSGYAPPDPKSAAVFGFHPFLEPYFGIWAFCATGNGSGSTTSSYWPTVVYSGAGRALRALHQLLRHHRQTLELTH